MSILIHGMEMPTSWEGCDFSNEFAECALDKDLTVCAFARMGNGCPLIELPPHGRLIDASEKVTVQIYDDMYEEFKTEEMTIDELLCAEWVEANAPTIIPAEGE